MAQQRDGPHEDVDADPLADGEPLQREVLRELECEEGEVENGAQPVELVLPEVCVFPVVRSRLFNRSVGVSREDDGLGNVHVGKDQFAPFTTHGQLAYGSRRR